MKSGSKIMEVENKGFFYSHHVCEALGSMIITPGGPYTSRRWKGSCPVI